MASTMSLASKLPRQIMLLMAISGKLSKPSKVSLDLHTSNDFLGSTLQASQMFIFLTMSLMHWSRLFQLPSQYLSNRFMYSNHFSGPRCEKMAIWCSSSRMIFWPTFCWPYSQSKQQQSVRQQLSQLQVGQEVVWQSGSRVMQFFSCRYSFLKDRRKTYELRLAAEMKMLTVDTFY